MNQSEVNHGAATDVGRVRQLNEDAYACAPPVFVVADGMGGHQGGEVASRIVAEEFDRLAGGHHDLDSGTDAITEALARSHGRILDYAEEQAGPAAKAWYAGTTAVIAMLIDHAGSPHWLLANVGDSRAYRITHEDLDQVSVDHSLVQELIDAGQITLREAEHHPERHVVTRALGGPEPPEPDFFLLPVTAAPRLLLCSDGVSGLLTDADMREILTTVSDPEAAATTIVAAAVAAGGHDNATAVVLDVTGPVTEADPTCEVRAIHATLDP